MPNKPNCKHCGSTKTIRNGHIFRFKGGKRYKQLRFLCTKCGRSTMGGRKFL